MAEGLFGGILGGEDEKPEVEGAETLAGRRLRRCGGGQTRGQRS
jgi:hypothetical protein